MIWFYNDTQQHEHETAAVKFKKFEDTEFSNEKFKDKDVKFNTNKKDLGTKLKKDGVGI
jgi:hypothetical protein